MFNKIIINDDYVISLCAIFQCSYLIDQASISNFENISDIEMLIKSIYITKSLKTKDIYYDETKLIDGLTSLKKVLHGKNDASLLNIQKYVLSSIILQKKINKINNLKNLIRKKIDNYHNNSMISENLNYQIKYSEQIYKEYISLIKPRVIISGTKEYLEKNSSLIRALLLSSIRAAFLWNELSGSKWHLILKRKEILNKCDRLFI